jgi:hypothetical protein
LTLRLDVGGGPHRRRIALGNQTRNKGNCMSTKVPSQLVTYVQGLTGAISRLLSSRLSETISSTDFGAIGDGVTDSTAAIANATQSGVPVFNPPGKYKVTTPSSSLTGPFYGHGQVQDGAGNLRGKTFTQISSRPSALSPQNGIETAFNGDLSHQPFSIEHRIVGASTLGTPASGGYLETPETAAYQAHLYNSSGAVTGNGLGAGRTAAILHYANAYQYGQGDCHVYNANAFVGSNNPNATNMNAAPAACLWTGQVTAGVDGCYLNPIEVDNVDNGHDVAGVGVVVNNSRTNGTANLGAWWYGYRHQSNGTVPVDVAFSSTGPVKFGLDLSYSTFDSNKAAITFKADSRIYGNVTANDPTGRYPIVTGDFITYASASNSWNLVAGNNPTLQVSSSQVTVAGVLATTGGIVGATNGSNADAGSVGEFVSSAVTNITNFAASGTAQNLTSIALTPGDWDLEGEVFFIGSTTNAAFSQISAGISTTSATLPAGGQYTQLQLAFPMGSNQGVTVPKTRVNVSASTTVYLVGSSIYSAGTMAYQCLLRARRVR